MSYYTHPDSPRSCTSTPSSTASAELKLYQAFIFSVPIFFTFILLLLFYLFYLRRRRVDWSSLRMRTSLEDINNDISRAEMGLKKELREMLPIIIYKESFSIRDTQCSVCLGDYQAEDKLQQIPACGHAFHMDCIDHWLASHITCPLCRLSLLASAKAPSESPDTCQETSREFSVAENTDGTSDQPGLHACEETQAPESSVLNNRDARTLQNSCKEEERSSECSDRGGYSTDTSSEAEEPGLQDCEETQASESPVLNNGDARTLQNSCKEEERSPECSDQGGDSTDTSSEAEEHEPSRGIPGNMHRLSLSKLFSSLSSIFFI
ncbi:hypothetical protein Dsin_001574 [Dipteronia sinensis]|uniref:RING-type E3 ubiquitin transferase n=1 Tax=Dipteronia sinensis TaxID=43782 RepID=A0AAE0B4A0_9ROSI|nr:hypothetical protein Dsin_001574 [Dipteronia sinensis]